MKNTIFEYSNYKSFVNALILSYPKEGRGQRKALAEHVGCQVAYITHVLSGDNHFSLEQAEAVARYFALTRDEAEYFLLLVQQNRAGTQPLRKFLDHNIKEKRSKHLLLKNRLKIKETLDHEAQSVYYSSWQFAAVHMALTIPSLRTPKAIADRLSLSEARALEILEFLCLKGLAVKEFNQYKTEVPLLHLEVESPLLAKHHSNWRLRALAALDDPTKDDLHYSLVFSVAQKDLPKIRETITQALEACASVIKPSKEEELVSLCVDLFRT